MMMEVVVTNEPNSRYMRPRTLIVLIRSNDLSLKLIDEVYKVHRRVLAYGPYIDEELPDVMGKYCFKPLAVASLSSEMFVRLFRRCIYDRYRRLVIYSSFSEKYKVSKDRGLFKYAHFAGICEKEKLEDFTIFNFYVEKDEYAVVFRNGEVVAFTVPLDDGRFLSYNDEDAIKEYAFCLLGGEWWRSK